MAVALHAGEARAHDGLPGGVDPVYDRGQPELLIVASALVVGEGVTVESRGDELFVAGLGEQVAGKLLGEEPVVRHVVIEGSNQPVAVPPDRSRLVGLVALGVGVAGEVQPYGRPALPETRGGEQAVDEPLVGLPVIASCERFREDFRRRHPRQVEGGPPGQGAPVRRGGPL